jgi:hypothetical protein
LLERTAIQFWGPKTAFISTPSQLEFPSVDNPQTELTVSPNPASASTVELTLSTPQAQFLEGSLYDVNGRRVQAFQWQHGEGRDRKTLLLDPGLPDGIYVLRLRGQDQVYSQKLIKQ